MAPEYLCELVSIRMSTRKLRSSSQILVQVPVSRLKSYGDCTFSVAASSFCHQILEMRRLLNLLNPFLKNTPFMEKY